MALRDVVTVIARRWWLVVLVPAIVLPLLIVQARTRPYQSSFKAIVLLPGDTEIPGSSERPELMVLDDLPTLMQSTVFAEAVAADLAVRQSSIAFGEVHGSVDGSRYSRVLTVTVTRESKDEVREIADAVAAVLPAQVNANLVADPATEPASVNVVDPPGEPSRSRENDTIKMLALTLLAAVVGAGIALLAGTWNRPSESATG